MTDLNPQARQMADESMVRTLAAQARAIWPQEKPLFARYELPRNAHILDAGCGTGEGAARIAELFPEAIVLGIDIIDAHLELARERHVTLASRLTFEHRSVFETGLAAASFDLVACRHVLHSIPHTAQVLAELVRLVRPGGWLHLIVEDYGMLHFERHGLDLREFWHEVPAAFGDATGTDMFVGRHTFGLLAGLGLQEIAVDYVVVDTLRVPRETFAQILGAWRDGFAGAIGELTPMSAAQARERFDQAIADVRDPARYAAWMVPVVSARVPPAGRATG